MEPDALETIATGLDHPEGIAWDPSGSLVAGGEAGQVYRVGLDGHVEEVARTDGFMFGVTVGAGGVVYGCDFGRGSVVRVDASGGWETLSTGTDRRAMAVPNYAAFDDEGNLYVTDSGAWGSDDGVVFRISAGGETTLWSTDVPSFPNGCCVTGDGSALLIVESRARRVVRVGIEADGSAGAPEPVADLAGSQPDGIALATDGTMFVGCYRPDRIWRIPPGGEPEIMVEDQDGVVLNQPANVAFFGPDLDRLAISSLGGWNIVAADVGAVGVPLRIGVSATP